MQQFSYPSTKRTGVSRNGRLAGAKVHVQNSCTLWKTKLGYILYFQAYKTHRDFLVVNFRKKIMMNVF
jgi:hypothetical protein